MNRREWEARNHERDDGILAEYEAEDKPSLSALGKKHGLCAQRIHQIVRKAKKRRAVREGKDAALPAN